MKKNIIKSILIIAAAFMLISFIVPVGIYSSGSFIEGEIVPIGLFDGLKYSTAGVISNFGSLFASIILIGGLYGMLKNNDRYNNLVNKIVSKFRKNPIKLLSIVTLSYLVIASVTGLSIMLFIFIPFTVALIMMLGYSRMTAFASSVGAILVGNLASTVGYSINGRISEIFNMGLSDAILYRIIFLVAIVLIYIYFIFKAKVGDIEDIPLFSKTKKVTKKSCTSMIVIFCALLLFVILEFYCIDAAFKINFFGDLYNSINNIKVGNLNVITGLLGFNSALGYGTMYDFLALVIVLNLIIKFAYKTKVKDFIAGVKEMIPTGLMILAAGIVFAIIVGEGSYPLFGTIFNALYNLSNSIGNISVDVPVISAIVTFVMTILSNIVLFIAYFIGGLFDNFYYLLWVVNGQTVSISAKPAVDVFLMQTGFGLSTLLLPTSALLVGGLTYFDIEYKYYFKRVFKFILISLIAIAIVAFLIGLAV